ncbi:MAG: ABC transporter permease subunit [Limibacillus sp.]
MFRFLVSRLAMLVPTFLGVTVISFMLIRAIPGDPIELLSGERGMDPERHAELMKQFGFDRPLYEQYFSYLVGIFQGDLGNSITTKQPVLNEFLTLFPATLELSLFAIVFAIALGLPIGVLAAVRRGSAFDHSSMTFALAGYSMPIFWWGILLIMVSSTWLGLTPVSGRSDLIRFYYENVTGFMVIDAYLSGQDGAVLDALHHLVLPTIVLGTIPMAVIARQTRSAMMNVLNEDYVRTARAKGLSGWRVIGLHALRTALITVVTVIGLQVGVLLAGAILTETIFAWPGVGKWMVDSISRRDYPSVQGGLLLIATLVMVVNLIVDLLYGLINPRIRHAR